MLTRSVLECSSWLNSQSLARSSSSAQTSVGQRMSGKKEFAALANPSAIFKAFVASRRFKQLRYRRCRPRPSPPSVHAAKRFPPRVRSQKAWAAGTGEMRSPCAFPRGLPQSPAAILVLLCAWLRRSDARVASLTPLRFACPLSFLHCALRQSPRPRARRHGHVPRNLLAFVALVRFSGEIVTVLREFGVFGLLRELVKRLKRLFFDVLKSSPVIGGISHPSSSLSSEGECVGARALTPHVLWTEHAMAS